MLVMRLFPPPNDSKIKTTNDLSFLNETTTNIDNLDAMKLGFKDVEMLLFKPRLHSLLNLVGVQYCLSWLGVRAEYVLKALQYCKILDRQVCSMASGCMMNRILAVSLANLLTAKEEEALGVLYHGAVHEVLRVQISTANPSSSHWYSQSIQTQG